MFFTEKECGNWFEFGSLEKLPPDYDLDFRPDAATHWVRITHRKAATLYGSESPFRVAKVLKTVCYIWTDEDGPTKWHIHNKNLVF